MPWVLIPGALRQLRKAKGWDRKDLAKKTGLDERTIHRHETPRLMPLTLQSESVRRYRAALECAPEAFVKWEDEPDKRREPKTPDPTAPKISTLTERAKHEHFAGINQTMPVRGELLEVVGNLRLKGIMTTFARYEGRRFVIQGAVTETKYIPTPAAKVLGAKPGEGIRCRIDRDVVKGLPVYASVFVPKGEQAQHLLDAHTNEKNVALVCRVFVKNEEADWKGFFIFETRPKPRPWVFVLDEILPSSETPS